MSVTSTGQMDLALVAGEPFAPAPLDCAQVADMTGVVLTFLVRAHGGAVDLLSQALNITDPAPPGTATLALTAEQTALLAPGGDYRYKVEANDGTVIIRGRLNVWAEWG